jgi:hypothetical protein
MCQGSMQQDVRVGYCRCAATAGAVSHGVVAWCVWIWLGAVRVCVCEVCASQLERGRKQAACDRQPVLGAFSLSMGVLHVCESACSWGMHALPTGGFCATQSTLKHGVMCVPRLLEVVSGSSGGKGGQGCHPYSHSCLNPKMFCQTNSPPPQPSTQFSPSLPHTYTTHPSSPHRKGVQHNSNAHRHTPSSQHTQQRVPGHRVRPQT